MILRYDFNKKLNLSDFKSRFYSYLYKNISYTIFLHDFRIDINVYDDKSYICISIYSVIRDNDDDISYSKIICPFINDRLNPLDIVKKMFPDDSKYFSEIDLNRNKNEIVKDVCDLISGVYKISNLKAFL